MLSNCLKRIEVAKILKEEVHYMKSKFFWKKIDYFHKKFMIFARIKKITEDSLLFLIIIK